MLRKINHIVCILLACCLFYFSSQAQNEISMPYSSYGIGMVNRSSNGVLDAMGGVSYAMQSPYYVNFRNPASYAAFDSLSFIADAAASVYMATLNQRDLTQKNTYNTPRDSRPPSAQSHTPHNSTNPTPPVLLTTRL